MTYEEATESVTRLRANFERAFSVEEKDEIRTLYGEVLGKEFKPTTCQQCYHDALIEIYLYLKREKRMAQRSRYRMRAGFIISCPNFHGGKIYNNSNLTDEVAKEYLERYPKARAYFDIVANADEATSAAIERKPAAKRTARKRTTRTARKK